ncbi:MAG: MFS transporter [Calothrix sp. SM1_5_4]|nr:MFS transporter [Calothrix sp. SM1_5_4]
MTLMGIANPIGRLFLASALSTAGSLMSTVALSTLIFSQTQNGMEAAKLQALSLFGIALAGIFGGFLLSRICAIRLGILSPLIAMALLAPFGLALEFVPTAMIYATVLCLSVLTGVEHPNLIRVINWNLDPEDKTRAFSNFQTMTQGFMIFSPFAAGVLISKIGFSNCILIDIATYAVSALTWLSVRHMGLTTVDCRPPSERKFWEGYVALTSHRAVRTLNLSRILINVSYVSFNVGLPIFVGSLSDGNAERFAALQGAALTALNTGFVVSGTLAGLLLRDQRRWIVRWSRISALIGFSSVCLVSMNIDAMVLLAVSFLMGVGTHFFRVSGMTLGSTLTPPNLLGSVIVAGDTVVRLASFGIGLTVPVISGVTVGEFHF